jgi:heavy metal translocating P-type ATPase
MFVMASGAFWYGGLPIHRRAWSSIKGLSPGMETLVSIGASCAYFYSIFQLLKGNSLHLYFDTASMLIFLVLLGKWLERHAKKRLQSDLEGFFELQPQKACIVSDAFPQGRYAAIENLQQGSVFKIREGEIAAADGLVIAGRGQVDESSLTGESRPRPKKEGQRIISGSRVTKGSFHVRATQTGTNSTLSQMVAIMQQALGQKAPIEGFTEKLLRRFVPLILGLAVLTLLVGWLTGLGIENALIRTVTVLVIACPCALGVAVPLARVAGISVATRKGILVRRFAAFEQAAHIDHFVFDKTGTVTVGNWQLIDIQTASSYGSNEIVGLALGLERSSDHPIAEAIRRYAHLKGINANSTLTNPRIEAQGIVAQLSRQTLRIGTRAYAFNDKDSALPKSSVTVTRNFSSVSTVYLSLDYNWIASLSFGDSIREDAPEVMLNLAAQGFGLTLLSGDSQRVTTAVGHALAIQDCRGNMLPNAKAMTIQKLQQPHRQVAMAGDGINDAPAMAQAELGLAMFRGMHLQKEVASVSLMRNDLSQITDFLGLAHRVNRKIRQNLTFSLLYNLLAIPIAMAGLLNPLIAVTAMLLSSLSVIFNTLLLLRGKSQ